MQVKKIGPAGYELPSGARNRRKASVKIRRNPSHHLTDRVLFFPWSGKEPKFIQKNVLETLLSLLEFLLSIALRVNYKKAIKFILYSNFYIFNLILINKHSN